MCSYCITPGSDTEIALPSPPPLKDTIAKYPYFLIFQVPLKAFESYCYISDTFTLPRKETINQDAGSEIHPGVGPIGSNSRDELVYHNYYMWIPYLLFFQSISFYVPCVLHKFLQVKQAPSRS